MHNAHTLYGAFSPSLSHTKHAAPLSRTFLARCTRQLRESRLKHFDRLSLDDISRQNVVDPRGGENGTIEIISASPNFAKLPAVAPRVVACEDRALMHIKLKHSAKIRVGLAQLDTMEKTKNGDVTTKTKRGKIVLEKRFVIIQTKLTEEEMLQRIQN